MALDSYRRLFKKKKNYHQHLPQSAPRRRKPRVCVQRFMVMVKKCCVWWVEGGWRGESANVDEISAGACQLLWIIPLSTKRLACASQHEYWIINGIMFLLGKCRRSCLRSFPLLQSLLPYKWSFHWKNYCTGCSIYLVAFCSLHLIKQIGYIQLRWMGAKWVQTTSRKQEEMMVAQHTYGVLLRIISMSSPLSRFSMPGAIDRMTKRST